MKHTFFQDSTAKSFLPYISYAEEIFFKKKKPFNYQKKWLQSVMQTNND